MKPTEERGESEGVSGVPTAFISGSSLSLDLEPALRLGSHLGQFETKRPDRIVTETKDAGAREWASLAIFSPPLLALYFRLEFPFDPDARS